MKSRFFVPPKTNYFLFGPRGTGKSTWLKNYYLDATIIDLLNPGTLRQYSAFPERLFEITKAESSKTIIIDEIQKAPELLSVVHSLIEQKEGHQFILTGSSSRKLKRSGVDLLAGRASIRHLHPFMASELGDQFSLETALHQGMIPLVIESENVLDTLRAYIGIYLNEEVKAEGLVRNIGDFSRFLEVMSFSHGSILNNSNIARECSVSRKLIEGYLSVLEDLLLSIHLPVFTTRAKRQLVSHQKFYYFDVGIYRNLRLTGFLDKTIDVNGPGLEGLVLQNLRAWNDYQHTQYKFFYWRTKFGVEVDFVIYGSDAFYAIEVKNGVTIHPEDLKGLTVFLEDYPEATGILLYRGKEKLKKKNIICLPVEEFLKNLFPGKALVF